MELLTFIGSVFGKTENIAIVVLLIGWGLLAFMYLSERKENRVDRNAMLDLIGKNTEALNGVKIALELLRAKVG